MKKYVYFSLFLLFGQLVRVQAQDLTMNYYSYVHNLYNINPAYCAIGHKLAGVLDVRQKTGLNETNAMLGLSGQLSENQGAGARLIADTRGPFQVLILDATYGYKLSLSENRSLYFGLSAGFNNKSINTSKIKNYNDLDANDPVLNLTNFKSTSFMAGAGMIYEHKGFKAAISAPQLIATGQKSFNYITVMVGNIFKVNKSIDLTPTLFYFNTPIVKDVVSLQVKGEYSQKVWLQLGYQTNSLFNACVGYNLGNLGIAYNYWTSNKLSNVQTSGTHEVILTLRVGKRYRNRHMDPHEEHIE